MLLVPSDARRKGFRTTEFWLCAVCSAVLAAGAIVVGSGVMAGAAAMPVSVYCVCRTVIKSRIGIDAAKLAPADKHSGL